MLKMYDKHTNIFINILIYLFVTLTLLQCNSVYFYSLQFHIGKVIVGLLWQGILLGLLFLSIKSDTKLMTNTRFSLFIIFFILIAVFFIIYELFYYPAFSKIYILTLFIDTIMLILWFYHLYDIKSITLPFIKFENVTLIVSIISLIFWIAFILKIPTNTSIFIAKWGAPHSAPGYFGVDFLSQFNQNQKFLGISWLRNSSFFAEPSMFSYVLLISILIELFMRHHTKIINYKMCILLITIISTASTTGILVSFVAFIYYLLLWSHTTDVKYIVLIIGVPLIFIFLKSVFINKFNTTEVNSLTSSSSIRYDDIMAGLRTWKAHLLLGCGVGNDLDLEDNMSSWRFMNVLQQPKESAGFTTILAEGGAILGLFYLLPTIIISRYSNRLLGLAIFSFIPFIFVVAQGFYIYIMILSYFWTLIIINNDNIK